MAEFQVGDKVYWDSQSGGQARRKEGTVVYVLKQDLMQRYEAPWRRAQELFPDHKRMFDGVSMPGPVAYFVEVKPTPRSKPRLYFPRPSQLNYVIEEK